MTKTTDATNNFEQVDTIEVMNANTYNIENFYADESWEANLKGIRKETTASSDTLTLIEEGMGRAANHSGTIANHSGTIANHSGTIANHSGTIANHSGTIANHSGTIANEVTSLNTKVADLTAEVQILSKTVSLLLGKILDVLETKLN